MSWERLAKRAQQNEQIVKENCVGIEVVLMTTMNRKLLVTRASPLATRGITTRSN